MDEYKTLLGTPEGKRLLHRQKNVVKSIKTWDVRVWDVFVTRITVHTNLLFKILLPSAFKDTLCWVAERIQLNKMNY